MNTVSRKPKPTRSTNPKPTWLFVSHISQEAGVAALLKQMMEDDFLGLVKLFTSSDVGSIDLGANWLDAVEAALRDAAAVIVLCSKASVHKPWVQFEVGAAWMKKKPIIPVCHSGMTLADLKVPLALQQGVELGTERGLEQLYKSVADQLKLSRTPRPKDMQERLRQIGELELLVRQSEVQFERYIDIVIPAPGRLDKETIPDSAMIKSDRDSLEPFGFINGEGLTWKDIVKAAQKTPDRRWLGQLQHCVYLASNNLRFRPVQAVYHTEGGSYQPQLAKKEVLPTGASSFHVHFVDTVVAPLSEVQNDFGLLATLLRLGLRFRYEVIERFQKQLVKAGTKQTTEEKLAQLRGAIEVIENDALSRGAENIDRDAVAALFESEDQQAMTEIQDTWDEARALLFRSDPPPNAQELSDVIACMRGINFRFMDLGTRRFHEMVHSRWSTGVGETPSLASLVQADVRRFGAAVSLSPGAGCLPG